MQISTLFGDNSVSGFGNDGLDVFQLGQVSDQRDHNFGNNLHTGAVDDVDSGFDNGGCLHFGDFRIGNGETASAVTHHRVELVQRADDSLDFLDGDVHFLAQSLNVIFFGREELVKRRVEEANGYGVALHSLVESLKVASLHRQDLGKSNTTLFLGLGDDHLTNRSDSVSFKEHMLGTAQTDSLSTELECLLGVGGSIGVGANLHSADFICPAHKAAEITADGSVDSRDSLEVDIAGAAVERDIISAVYALAGELKVALFLVDSDFTAAGNAAGSHSASDNGGVRGHTAANGEDTLGYVHTLDIFRRSFETNKNDLPVFLGGVLNSLIGRENYTAAGSTRRSGKSRAGDNGVLESGGVELRMEQGIKLLRVDHKYGLFLVDHTLVNEVAGDLESGGSGTLAVTGLEHIELTAFDGELHILHIFIVIFKLGGDVNELLINLGHSVVELIDCLRGTNTGDNVLALSVHKEFAEQLLFAGGGVTGKGNACTGIVAHIAEYHRLYVDGSTPRGGDIVHTAIIDGALVVPRTEYGLDSAHELLTRLLREVYAELLLVELFEADDHILEILGVQLGVHLDTLLFLEFVDDFFEALLRELHNDVGIHLNETAIAVESKALVVHQLGDSENDLIVDAEVEDGIHHTGH